MPASLVVLFAALYVACSILAPKNKRYLRWASVPVVILYGSLDHLWLDDSILVMAAAGALVGQAAFLLSMILVGRPALRKWIHRIGPRRILAFVARNPGSVVMMLVLAGHEELLWRCTVQAALGSGPTAVLVTAIGFTMIHITPGDEVVFVMPYLDILVFALTLGMLFLFFENFYIVLAAHFIRNLNICCLRDGRDSIRACR